MSGNWVEEVFQLVGAASRCWKEDGGKGVFDEQSAIRIADRLCDIVREQRSAALAREEPRTKVRV